MNKYLLASMLFVSSDVFGMTEIVSYPNDNGKRNLHYQTRNKRVKNSVNDIDMNGNAALHLEIVKTKIDNVSSEIKSLIKQGADVNQPNREGDSPAKLAFMRNNQDLVKYLIDCGANINQSDRHGHTLLHLAALENNEKMMIHFIEKRADVNQQDNHGRTPLHFVAQWGNEKMAAYLIEKGAKINQKNREEQTPLDIAKQKHNERMIEYLVKKSSFGRLNKDITSF